MRILHTIPGLNESSGGPTTYNLIKGLRAIDVDVLMLLPKSNFDKIISVNAFIKAVENGSFSLFVYSSLCMHREYDLYHANALWTYPTHATFNIAKRYDRPCIIAPHGMLYSQVLSVLKWRKKIALKLFQRRDIEMASCLQATCLAEVEHIRALGVRTPVAVIPNGLLIDRDCIRKVSNFTKRFAFVGRLNRIKNVTNIDYLGSRTNEEVLDLMRCYDILVLPSRYDGWGAVVNEALQNGMRVIASENCGASVLLDRKERGTVFSFSKENSLEKVLLCWLDKGVVSQAERQKIIDWTHRTISGGSVAGYFEKICLCLLGKYSRDKVSAPWLNLYK